VQPVTGIKGRAISHEAESKEDVKEEAIDEPKSEIKDCIIVDIEEFVYLMSVVGEIASLRHDLR
jgi:hypothetical protein